jgi:hypothetical protein
LLYVDSYIIQYVKFWDIRRALAQRRTRAHVVPEEMEDLSRGMGDLVLLTAESPLFVGNGNKETRLQQPKPRKRTLSAIEEVASSQMFLSEAPSGMALSPAFLLQTTLSEIGIEDEASSKKSTEDPSKVAFIFQTTPTMSGVPGNDNHSPRLLEEME